MMTKETPLIYQVATKYSEPRDFFGNEIIYDQVSFSDVNEMVKYIRGEVAHNWLDDTVKLLPDEVIEQIWTEPREE